MFPFPVRSQCFVVFVVSSSRIFRTSSGPLPSLSLPSLCCFLAAHMYRGPVRPQRSPGAPRPAGRFPSPASCWGYPGPRSPYGGSGHHRGGSPRGCGPAYSPGSPAYSPGSNRGYRNSSPTGFGSGSRGFGGQMWRRGGGFPRPHSPASAQKFQVKFVKTEVTCLFQ